jgi:antitoxin YefM
MDIIIDSTQHFEKEDWESLQETLYLQSIPNFVSEIKKAEQLNDWVSEAEFMRTLDGLED